MATRFKDFMREISQAEVAARAGIGPALLHVRLIRGVHAKVYGDVPEGWNAPRASYFCVAPRRAVTADAVAFEIAPGHRLAHGVLERPA